MVDNEFDLNLLRLFVSMVESATLTEAAARAGVTRSHISKRLQLLERALGTQLMLRTTRHVELTQAGHLLFEHATRVLREVDAAKSSIHSLGKTMRGDIRIRVPTGLGTLYLSDVLLVFAKAHPEVSLRVVINDHIGDLISAEVDMALKITSSPPEDHVARKLCAVEWALCATPAFLRGRNALSSPEELTTVEMIAPASLGRRFNLKLTGEKKVEAIRVSPRLVSGDYPFLRKCLLADLGVALLPRYAVWGELKRGAVVEVLPEWAPEGVGDGLFLLTAPNRYPTLAARSLMDFLREAIVMESVNWMRSR